MSIETSLVTTVGDGVDAVKATSTLTCVFANIVSGMTITLNIPEEEPIVFTHGDDFTGGSDDNSFAEELMALFAAVAGLTATRANNVVTIEHLVGGEFGNEWEIESSEPTAVVATAFINGRDADEPVELILKVDKNGIMTGSVDGDVMFRTPFSTLFGENTKTFQVELQNFTRKFQV